MRSFMSAACLLPSGPGNSRALRSVTGHPFMPRVSTYFGQPACGMPGVIRSAFR